MDQETEVKEVKKQERYINRDIKEVLTDSLDIAYYRALQNDEIIENLLIGGFNELGEYNIDKPYLLELVSVEKIIKEKFDDKYILAAVSREGYPELKFTLKIETNEAEKKKTAVLKYIETNTKADGKNKELLKTVVARYKDEDDIYFMIKVRKVFHILEKEDELGRDIKNEEVLILILKRWQELKRLKINRKMGKEIIDKEYIDTILEILKNNPGRFSNYVLRRYALLLVEMQSMLGKSDYYSILKARLDRILDGAKRGISEPSVLDAIEAARKSYLVKYENIHKKLLIEANMAATPAKKEEVEEKSSEGKSASGGGKGGTKSKVSAKSSAGSTKAVKKSKYYLSYPPRVKDNSTQRTAPKPNAEPVPENKIPVKDSKNELDPMVLLALSATFVKSDELNKLLIASPESLGKTEEAAKASPNNTKINNEQLTNQPNPIEKPKDNSPTFTL
jgi:hypothetical protein